MKISQDGNTNYDLEGILNLIINEEKIVINPIKIIENLIPKKSAVIPETTAPIAYPKSLQSLNTPILSAL